MLSRSWIQPPTNPSFLNSLKEENGKKLTSLGDAWNMNILPS